MKTSRLCKMIFNCNYKLEFVALFNFLITLIQQLRIILLNHILWDFEHLLSQILIVLFYHKHFLISYIH